MSLCSLTIVQKARKSPGECGKCHAVIEPGQSYLWWQGRFGPKRVRCRAEACYPNVWERETNGTKATDMEGSAAAEEFAQATELEAAREALETALSLAADLVADLEERVANKEGTPLEQTEEFQALSTSLEEFTDYHAELERLQSQLEEMAYDEDTSSQELSDRQAEAPAWPELDLGSYGPPQPRRKAKVTS